jgi:glyoxylase-like metal-dependent hydrolase (beta-lactamase superfamily II)/rhodanese-related sulfurtransferase
VAIHTAAQTIDADELQAMLEEGEPITILDVRKSADRAEWSIPGSRHIDAYEALKAGDPAPLANIEIPADLPVVTVCAEGRTSLAAMEYLRERGYDARSLAGGMKAWSLAWNTADVPVPGSAARVIQIRRTGKGCLSYLIGNDGAAAVIDASLDPAVYQRLAANEGWVITDVLETHIHADHLSRARLLAEATGARLHLPEQDRASYPFIPIRDGDRLAIGSSRLLALRTPGHTVESTCYLLDGKALFTGDTLFVSGVGRPDLEASAGEARARARLLHASLRRLAALPADTVILSGHTSEPVPFDRKPIVATRGDVSARVRMLELAEDAFVAAILARIPPAPPHHSEIVAHNEAGTLPHRDPTDLEAGANRCAVT